MNNAIRLKPLAVITVLLIVIAAGLAWCSGVFQKSKLSVPANAIMVIAPYRDAGTWVFDDPRVGIVREPFVSGVPEMIDKMLAGIPAATNGFRLLFSMQPFPDYQKKLILVRPHMGGNYYRFDGTTNEGWICPALFKYNDVAPKELYLKAEPKI